MDFTQFDALAQKVERALTIIDEMKQEREALKDQLHNALERAGNLEKAMAEKDEELASLRNELNLKSDNINMAGERIRDMVSRLETALA
jgi:chromosome segregation ATPase